MTASTSAIWLANKSRCAWATSSVVLEPTSNRSSSVGRQFHDPAVHLRGDDELGRRLQLAAERPAKDDLARLDARHFHRHGAGLFRTVPLIPGREVFVDGPAQPDQPAQHQKGHTTAFIIAAPLLQSRARRCRARMTTPQRPNTTDVTSSNAQAPAVLRTIAAAPARSWYACTADTATTTSIRATGISDLPPDAPAATLRCSCGRGRRARRIARSQTLW